MHPAIHAVFGVFTDRYAYLGALYLLLAFPLGVAYFCLIAVGLSLGVGLLVLWIGLLVLAALLVTGFGLTAFERLQARHLLGATLGPLWARRPAAGAGLWERSKSFLANPVTWKGLAFHLIKFPLGLLGFVFLVTSGSISLALLAAPILYPVARYDVPWFAVDDPASAFALALVGAVGLVVTLHLIRAFALVWRKLAEWLLSGPAGPRAAASGAQLADPTASP